MIWYFVSDHYLNASNANINSFFWQHKFFDHFEIFKALFDLTDLNYFFLSLALWTLCISTKKKVCHCSWPSRYLTRAKESIGWVRNEFVMYLNRLYYLYSHNHLLTLWGEYKIKISFMVKIFLNIQLYE